MRQVLAAVIGLAVVSASATGRAEEPKRAWYGATNLAVDGAAVGTAGIGLVVIVAAPQGHDGPNLGALLLGGALVSLGGLLYLFGSPGIHIAHRKGLTAALSFGLRLLPAVPVLALRKANVVPLLVTLTAATTAGAIGIDDFVLAREDEAPTRTVVVVPTDDRAGAVAAWIQRF